MFKYFFVHRKTKRGPRGPLSGSIAASGADLGAQARRRHRGEHAQSQQVERSDPVEILHQGHDTHLEFGSWEPRGSGAVRLDDLWIPESEHCIDQRFRTAALRFRTCETRAAQAASARLEEDRQVAKLAKSVAVGSGLLAFLATWR